MKINKKPRGYGTAGCSKLARRVWTGLLFAAANAGAEVYQWTDEHGKAHFTDRPPAGYAVEEIVIRVNSYTATPTVTFMAADFASRFTREVILYSASWCGVCKRAKAYFEAQEIPYTEYDVETSRKGKADFRRLNGTGVPVILVGDRRMNGFSESGFERLWE